MQKRKYADTLWLGPVTYSKHQISMSYGIDKMRFTCSYWFSGVDLEHLQHKFTKPYLDKLIFHILCFEANKLCSLKPTYLDVGVHAQHWTEEFEQFWKNAFYKGWGQWRYLSNIPDYRGPIVRGKKNIQNSLISSVAVDEGPVKNMCFFGGGKDSLASTTLLDNIGQDYEILTYTNSRYGTVNRQLDILNGLLTETVKKKYHYTYVYDDFINCPILEIEKYDVGQIFIAETLSSIFLSLPYVLQNGYTCIILGNEKSADTGNVIWNNEDINHQWQKSTQAELVLRQYIQKELISNLTYYSILKPIYDTGIILVSSTREQHIPLTHSCNVQKPWCMKCPKCCYVWLLFMAYMDIELIWKMFKNVNMLQMPQNYQNFRQLLGLQVHTPFECVGRIEEVRICFELLRIKGVTGKAMDDFLELEKEDYIKLFEQYTAIDQQYEVLPNWLRQRYFTEVKRIITSQKPRIIQMLQRGKNI